MEESRDRVWFLGGVGAFGLVFLAVGFVFFLANKESPQQPKILETKMVISSPTPVIAEEKAEEYSISILNGSQVDGAAGKVKQQLSEKNSKLVLSTGNAAVQTGNSVSYRSEAFTGTKTARVISEIFPKVKVSFKNDQEFDIVLTIGK